MIAHPPNMRFTRRWLHRAVACAFVLAPLAGSAQTPRPNVPPERPDPTLQNLMDTYARHHHGKVSLYAKQVRSGQTVVLDPDVPVNTASVIKVAIMLEAMYQVKEGR